MKMSDVDKMAETIRLEEFTGLIQNKVVVVWSSGSSSDWLPTEFMLTQYITRILVVGRSSPVSVTLGSDASWTQVWRAPGAKEWSCLLGILQHMPGPVLVVVAPDIVLTPKVVAGLEDVTAIVLRSCGPSPSSSPSSCSVTGWQPSHVFFPVLGDRTTTALGPIVQEWVAKAVPRALDLKTLIPQLAGQSYGLMIAEGVWHWYKPADSPPLVTASVVAVAKQLQILGAALEKMTV